MVVNESAENYLETILILSKSHPVVRSVDIAEEMGFKKSSVSVAMKNLREKNHITVTREGFIYLTDSGRQTLEFFEKEISSEIRQDIQRYLTDHSYEMRNESSILADYYRTAGQDYAVHCRVKEGNTVLIDLTITVPTEGAAQTLCDNWKKKSQETYAAIMKLLM